MENLSEKNIIFFDLDGTLHRQSIFSCFLRYMIIHSPLNLLILILILPIVLLGILIKGYSSRWPMSILLWSVTFGHSDNKLKKLQKNFIDKFRKYINYFPKVLVCLYNHLVNHNNIIYIITGSPELLAKKIYYEILLFPRIHLIGSIINNSCFGLTLTFRCLGYKKIVRLKQILGIPLNLYSGYSDSKQDNPIIFLCKYRWKIDNNGRILSLNKNNDI